MSTNKVNNAKETETPAESANDDVAKGDADTAQTVGGPGNAAPEGLRAIAGQSVTRSRDAYENARSTMEASFEALERSLDQAGQGAAALNRKVIELAQTNLNTGFDLAKDLAGAKNAAEIMEVQASFVRKQFGAFATQAEEVRTLTTKIAADTASPIKDHVSRSLANAVTG